LWAPRRPSAGSRVARYSRHRFANFFEYRRGRFEMKCLAEPGAFKLVRQDAQQVEVAARFPSLRRLMQQLEFRLPYL